MYKLFKATLGKEFAAMILMILMNMRCNMNEGVTISSPHHVYPSARVGPGWRLACSPYRGWRESPNFWFWFWGRRGRWWGRGP